MPPEMGPPQGGGAGLAGIMQAVQGVSGGPPGMGAEPQMPLPRELMIQMIMLILNSLKAEGGPPAGGPPVGGPPMPPQGGLPF